MSMSVRHTGHCVDAPSSVWGWRGGKGSVGDVSAAQQQESKIKIKTVETGTGGREEEEEEEGGRRTHDVTTTHAET
jgi:hypothetical protein